jgi:hypothetical protein
MIYRKFMRPRELLDMFIARFDSVADSAQEDDTEANNTRLRYVQRKKNESTV